MSEPERPKEFEFSKRAIVLLAMIAAAALTIEGTYLILNAFVLHDPSGQIVGSETSYSIARSAMVSPAA
jgi:hypothetical protein